MHCVSSPSAVMLQAPSDDHDAAVLAAIEQEDAIIRERLAQQLSAPYETGSSSPSSSRYMSLAQLCHLLVTDLK